MCQAAGRPLGARLGLWGHGLRPRQQRGPLDPEGRPQIVVVAARRYRCTRCRAVILVVPRGVVPRRHYSGGAIALALVLWGVLGLLVSQVRERVNPWQVVGECARGGWATLRRWVEAIRRGVLFPSVRGCPTDFTLRQVAKRAAETLCAYALPSLTGAPSQVCAFQGGMYMA